MEGFANRIKLLCKEKGVSVKELENSIGVSNGYINTTARQGSQPKKDKLDKIAAYFGVTPNFILGLEEPPAQKASTGVLIPVLGRVAAGMPITAVENIIGQEEISMHMASLGEYFALKVKGNSMTPDIHDGDIVIVRQQDDADSGDIVIAIVNGDDGCCKKLKKLDNGIMLISLNPAYEPMIFTASEIDSIPVQIIGKVMEMRRSF